MADIKMIKFHSLPLARAKELVQKAADDLGAEYDLASEWSGNALNFRRSGVDGSMQVTPSEIRLEVTLGFLLKPFKARLVESIEHNFDSLLAHAARANKPAKTSAKAPASKAVSKQAKAAKKVGGKPVRKA